MGSLRIVDSGEEITAFDAEPDEILLAIDRGTLGFLASSVGEALEAIEEWEFQTRLGETREVARTVLRSINEILSAS
jgi:hypothetical protein